MTVPKSFWDNEQLSLTAKWVAITLDSYIDNPNGTPMGVRAIQSATNLSAKEVKDAMTELYEHGAMEVTACDGQKFWKPLLYRDSYPKVGEKIIVGDKVQDADPINYDLILDTWNEYCGDIQKMERMTPQRKRKTRTALKGAARTYEDLIKAIKTIPHSAFLSGRKSADWIVSFDWLIKSPENVTKVLEGKYHRDFNESTAFNAVMRGEEANQKSEENDFYK